MSGFLGEKEILSRERVKEIFRKKEYSYLEEKVNLLEVTDDSLLLKISFLVEYKNRMISIEERRNRSQSRSKTSRSKTGATACVRSPISNKPP